MLRSCGIHLMAIFTGNTENIIYLKMLENYAFEIIATFLWALHWCHDGRDGVSNHQPHDCLLNRLFRRRSKKTSKLRVTDLSVGNSPVTGEFPAQMAGSAENVSILWRHHGDNALMQEAREMITSVEFAKCTKFLQIYIVPLGILLMIKQHFSKWLRAINHKLSQCGNLVTQISNTWSRRI